MVSSSWKFSGLNKLQINFIEKTILKPLSSLESDVFIFGSRSLGTYKKFSDLDLLICPKNEFHLSQVKLLLSEINEKLEESSFPYKVDLILQNTLSDDFKFSIKNTLKKLSSF